MKLYAFVYRKAEYLMRMNKFMAIANLFRLQSLQILSVFRIWHDFDYLRK